MPPPRPSFWNPFSQRFRSAAEGVKLVSGKGSTLTDSEGNDYVDATAALWYCLIGHGRGEMAEAIAEQVRTLEASSGFDIFASDVTLGLADLVVSRVPVDDAVAFFTSGGSDSVETAVKVARLYWRSLGEPAKRHVIHRENSYHGTHGIGTSLAGIDANRDGFGSMLEDTSSVPMFDAPGLEHEIERVGPGAVAAVIAEPVIGAGGVHPPPPEYLPAVREICSRHDVLLIADEVVTGFGRTGSEFACNRYGIRPDIMILAKGLTSGYLPLGATVFAGHVVEPFEGPDGPWLRHGYTYSGHATACAAANANLRILDRESLVERTARLEPVLAQKLAPLASRPGVTGVRTVGLTAAVQLDPAIEGIGGPVGLQVVDECRRRGVLTRLLAGAGLHVSPPLVIEESELDVIAETFDAAIGAVLGA